MAFVRPTQPTPQAELETSPLQFIMTDPALCLCPGLFRHLSKADLDTPVGLHLTYTHGSTLLRVRGPLLSGFDLAILQAISVIAAATPELISPMAAGEHSALTDVVANPSQEYRDLVDEEDTPIVLRGPHADDEMCFASCSIAQLLRAVALPVNAHYTEQAIDSLGRLSSITLFVAHVDAPRQFQSLRLLAHCRVNKDNRRAHVVQMVLHPRLTNALVNRTDQDTRMTVAELQKIGTDSDARVLHQRLCAIVNDGTTRQFKVQTLMDYLYPEDKSGLAQERYRARNAQQAHDYRQGKLKMVSDALATIGNKLNWDIFPKDNAPWGPDLILSISRPAEDWTRAKLHAREKAAALALDADI